MSAFDNMKPESDVMENALFANRTKLLFITNTSNLEFSSKMCNKKKRKINKRQEVGGLMGNVVFILKKQ